MKYLSGLVLLFLAALIVVQSSGQGWPYSWRLIIISTLIGFAAFAIRRLGALTPSTLPSQRQSQLRVTLLSFLIGIGIWLVTASMELSAYFGYPVVPLPEVYPSTLWQAFRLSAALVIFVPISSEVLFRGVIQHACEPWGRRTALAISTSSFLLYYLFAVRLMGFFPALFLGMTLGYIALQTRFLISSLLVHSVVNGLTTGIFILNGLRPDWIANFPIPSFWTAGMGAALVSWALWQLTLSAHNIKYETTVLTHLSRKERTGVSSLVAMLITAAIIVAISTKPPAQPLLELTPKQKEAEFRYLTRLVREVYPLSDAIAQIKSLDNPVLLEDDYIQRATKTKDNWEYYQVFREYFVRLSHGGHAYVLSPESASYYNSWYLGYDFGLYPSLLKRANYWWAMEERLEEWYAYSELAILYQNGNYVLANPAIVEGQMLPAGTLIQKVEGLSVHDYVKQQQARERLQFDTTYNKVFIRWAEQKLLLVDPGPGHDGWQVDFRLPDGSEFQGLVRKFPGRNWASVNTTHPNVIAVELGADVGYLRVFSFIFQQDDDRIIQDFIQRSNGRYQKLIIDVRGNGGGEPRYWMDSLAAPLIKQPLTYELLSAVRRQMFDRLNIRFWLYRLGGIGMFDPREHFNGIVEVAPPTGYDPQEWRAFRMRRQIIPANSFKFDGEVYVLMDDVCASACEDFVFAAKTTGFAKLVGVQTFGTAPGVFPAMPYTLPESGISFMLEANLVFNPDGTINQIYGTTPDVPLVPVLPLTDYDRKTLLEDPWVQWVLNQ